MPDLYRRRLLSAAKNDRRSRVGGEPRGWRVFCHEVRIDSLRPCRRLAARGLVGDAPECVVFRDLETKNWAELHARLNRGFADVADACKQAMTYADHHDWVRHAANKLLFSGAVLWQAMCGEWARTYLSSDDAKQVIAPIEQAILNFKKQPLGT
jgi:hypothetical protein